MRGEQTETILQLGFCPGRLLWSGGWERGPIRTMVSHSRGARESRTPQNIEDVQTEKRGQPQRCAVMSGLSKEWRLLRQLLLLLTFCSQISTPHIHRISLLWHPRGPETAAPGREVFSAPTSRAQGYFSFLSEDCSSESWLGHQARMEVDVTRWYCLLCYPLALI